LIDSWQVEKASWMKLLPGWDGRLNLRAFIGRITSSPPNIVAQVGETAERLLLSRPAH